jgi:hypothetical protein
MVLNCDLVVASDKAQFALPEVKRGVVAVQGGMFIKSLTYNYVSTSRSLLRSDSEIGQNRGPPGTLRA